MEVSEESLISGKSPIGENFVAPVGLDFFAIAKACIGEDAGVHKVDHHPYEFHGLADSSTQVQN